MIPFPIFGAAWIATDHSRALCALVLETFRRMGMNRKEIETYTGLNEKQQSDQFTLKQPLNLWRLADIPGFTRAFMEVLAEHEGCVVFDKRMVRLILHVDTSAKPMVKASLPNQPEEKAS